MKFAAALLGSGVIALIPAASLAEDKALTPDESAAASRLNARRIEVDTAIPESPGFAVIGFSPTQVIDPSATRVSLATLAGYVDGNGNLKPGLAFGGTPYLWLNPDLTLEEYYDLKMPMKVLARTQITAGVADGGDDQPDKVGVGFTFDVLDGGDYRRDSWLYDCVGKVYASLIASQDASRKARRAAARAKVREEKGWTQDPISPDQDVIVSTLANDIVLDQQKQEDAVFPNTGGVQKCRDDAKTQYADRASLVVAGGWAFQSNQNGFNNLDSEGGSFWAAYRHPIGKAPYYGVLFARYDVDRKTEVTTGVFQDYDRTTLAALGGYDLPMRGFKLSFEAGYERLDYSHTGPLKDEEAGFWAATMTQALPENGLLGHAWLELKVGSGLAAAQPSDHDDWIKASLRFGLPQK